MSSQKTTAAPYSIWLNNRFWLLLFSVVISIIGLAAVWTLVPAGDLRLIRLQQTYGFIGIIFLYVAVLATPLTKLYNNLPYRQQYLHLRRAIGVSAFYFAVLHGSIAFFGQLGGVQGVAFLTGRYQLALGLGLIGLLVLTAMAITSFDRAIDRMGFKNWKKLHRLVYLASIAILLHVVMLGTHFAYGSSAIARITLVAVLALLFLEAIRLDKALRERFTVLRHVGLASMVVLHIVFLGAGYMLGQSNTVDLGSIRTHNEHGSGQSSDEAYIAFTSSPKINGSTVKASKDTITFDALIAGGGTVDFNFSPALTDITAASCFVVNQETYAYFSGLSKVVNGTVQCLPIGDKDPPGPGQYTLYLKVERPSSSSTNLFNLEIE